MRKTLILFLMFVASPAWAYEYSLNLDDMIHCGCEPVPRVTYETGGASVSHGRCSVGVFGPDYVGGYWSDMKGYVAAFTLVYSTCDSVVANFWYMDLAETWREVRLIPFLTGGGKAGYRSPVFFGMKYLGHLEITGYGRNVNFNVARARVEWRDGTERKSGEEPSTWGALKSGFVR